jgi:hypothetical protein
MKENEKSNNESFSHELNFLGSITKILEHKKLFASITILVFLVSFLFAYSLPQHYQVSSFLSAPKGNLLLLNDELYIQNQNRIILPADNNELFTSNLYNLQSYKFLETIFNKNNFINKLDSQIDINTFLSKLSINSTFSSATPDDNVKLDPPFILLADKVLKSEINNYINFSRILINESQEKIATDTRSEFTTAIEYEILKLNQNYESKISLREYDMTKISNDKTSILNKIRALERSELSALEENAKIARKMGVIQPNFSEPGVKSYISAPIWFTHGEKSLRESAASVKAKFLNQLDIELLPLIKKQFLVESNYDENLSSLKKEILQLEELKKFSSSINISSIQVIKNEVVKINNKGNIIIFIGLFAGFFLGLLATILRMQYLELKPKA